MTDDRTLVDQARAGDAAAFTQLMRRHDDKMRGVVWPLVATQSDMDDVLQTAYLKAWRNLSSFRGDAAFTSWLYRIVHTTAIDHVRASARRKVVPIDELTERTHGSAADIGESVTTSIAVRNALAELPPDQLAVITLVEAEGQSYDTVADMLGISPGTVGSRLSRARATLRRTLNFDEGIDQ